MDASQQNALFAMQLFSPVAEGAERHRLTKQRLAEIAGNQQFAREQQQAAYAQQNAMTDKVLTRQNDQQESTERRMLMQQRAVSYPVYAQAAAAIGETPKPITDFPETWDGLGQLQAEMSTLKERASKAKEQAGAEGVVAVLDQATDQLKAAIEAREQVASISDSDRAQARQLGLNALQEAVESGEIPGLKAKSKKWNSILTALNKAEPDVEVARKLLGEQGIAAYSGGIQQGLLALQNDKERLARISAASRSVDTAMRGANEIQTRLMQLASTNPSLGPLLQQRSARLSALSATPAPAEAPTVDSIVAQLIAKSKGTGVEQPVSEPAPQGFTPPAFTPLSSLRAFAGMGGMQPSALSDFARGAPMRSAPALSPVIHAPESPVIHAPELPRGTMQDRSAPFIPYSQTTELDRLRQLLSQAQAPAFQAAPLFRNALSQPY